MNSDRRRSRCFCVIHAVCAAVAILLAGASEAGAFPKPAIVPYRWELKFQPGPLRLYTSSQDGRAYWYFTYEVINRTGKDQIWAPEFVLFTDSGEILASGQDVPRRVTLELLDLLGDPLLLSQNDAIGDLLQGAEHARSGLAVWPARRTGINELSLFVKGLSGESARVRNPVSGDDVVLYKTLQRDYLVPGSALARGADPIQVVQERWILR